MGIVSPIRGAGAALAAVPFDPDDDFPWPPREPRRRRLLREDPPPVAAVWPPGASAAGGGVPDDAEFVPGSSDVGLRSSIDDFFQNSAAQPAAITPGGHIIEAKTTRSSGK